MSKESTFGINLTDFLLEYRYDLQRFAGEPEGIPNENPVDNGTPPIGNEEPPSTGEEMTLEELIEKTAASIPEKFRNEFRGSFLKHKDYTQKTQSHAEQVRAFNAERERLENESRALGMLLQKDPSLINLLTEQSEEPAQPAQNGSLLQMLQGLSDEDKAQVAQMLAPQLMSRIVPSIDQYQSIKGSMEQFNEKYAKNLTPEQLAEYYNYVAAGVPPERARYAVMGEGIEKQLTEREEAMKKITGGFQSDLNAAKSEQARPPITDKKKYMEDLAREYDTKALYTNLAEGE